jgi:hypothetical protein
MSTHESEYRSSNAVVYKFLGIVAILTAFIVVGYWAIRRIDTLSPPATITAPITHPTAAAPAVQPPVVAPAAPVAPVVPTAHIPAVVVEQWQAAPAANVPVEEMQPRAEVVSVDRAPEQTTITRTIPQNPAGAPIVVDKGVKRRGAPRP